MSANVGDRAGAVISIKGGVAESLGFGVFSGQKIPDPKRPGQAGMLGRVGIPNPCITLDNGDVVYGCECWWGAEDAIKAKLNGLKVEEVRIGEFLK